MSDARPPALRNAYATGLDAAVAILRVMARQPSIRLLDGPAALRIVAEAIEEQAKKHRHE